MILNAVSWIRRIGEKVSNKFKQMFDKGASENDEISSSDHQAESITQVSYQNNHPAAEVRVFDNNETEINEAETNEAELTESRTNGKQN